MSNINISLPESMKAFVEEQVAQGGYGLVSEYLQELITQDLDLPDNILDFILAYFN